MKVCNLLHYPGGHSHTLLLTKIISDRSSTSSRLKNSKTQPNKRVGIAVAVLYLNQEVAPIHSSFYNIDHLNLKIHETLR